MKNKKLVFFDLDGTLLNSEKQVGESTKEAIFRLEEKGNIPVIATGRPPYMFDWIREETNIHNFVCTNGQYVVYNGKVLYEHIFNKTKLEALVSDAAARNNFMTFQNAESYAANHLDANLLQCGSGDFKVAPPVLDRDFHLHQPVHQGQLFCTSDEETFYKINHSDFDYIRFHEKAVDVVPKGLSKATGIQKLLEKLEFPVENTYAFGDGLNDVAMFQLVGHSIAMENGEDELKKHANYITSSCDNNGILNGLAHYKLI